LYTGDSTLSRYSSLSHSSPFFFLMIPPPPQSTLFPYTTLFRSHRVSDRGRLPRRDPRYEDGGDDPAAGAMPHVRGHGPPGHARRSEEHTSELQSRGHLVCRLLLEKKKEKARRMDVRAAPRIWAS